MAAERAKERPSRSHRRPGRRGPVMSGAVLMSSAVLGATVLVVAPGVVGAAGGEDITGVVFQDFDSDGVYDTVVAEGVAADIGLGDITVRAFDKAGDEVGSALTAADGTYTLTVSPFAVTNDVRVEFSVPTSGPLAALRPSFIGPDNAGTVQFVTAPATNVSLGLQVPAEYCQNSPNLAYSRLCSGTGTDLPTTFVTRYDAGPFSSYFPFVDTHTSWATNAAGTRAQTGSLLGMAWDPRSRRVIQSAYVRRHAALYESGGIPRPAALFSTTPNGTEAAEGTGGSTTFLVDLETLLPGDQFSNSNSAGPGYIPTNTARGLAYIADGDADGGIDGDGMDSDQVEGYDGVYEEVGAAGIGDIDTDGAGRLWVVSLYDKNLYQVSIPASGAAPTTMVSRGFIPDGVACTNGTTRPFSVKYWRGALYMGVVCAGNGDFDTSDLLAIKDANLTFSVVRLDLASSTWSTFFGPHALNSSGYVTKGPASLATAYLPTSFVWNPWTDWFPPVELEQAYFEARPVPMLSEIEFDRDGSMILGFRDRSGDQNGAYNNENPGGYATTDNVVASGDLYRVCRIGTGYASSDYAFEGSNLACPQTTNSYVVDGITYTNTEYYSAENFVGENTETSVGMIEQVPGFPSVVVNTVNPVQFADSDFTNGAGSQTFLNSNGLNSATVAFSGVAFGAWSAFPQPNTGGDFWESNGMSDVEALCDAAPLQIGNRVWIDIDKDGIQDPTEVTISGVTVRLYDSSGDLVGTAVTNANGEYLFSSNVVEANVGDGDFVGGGLVPNEAFTIRFDNPDDYLVGSGALYPYLPTQLRAVTSVPSDLDQEIDSDVELAGTGTYGVDDFPYIDVAPLTPGDNALALDAGFTWPVTSVGDYVWIDLDQDGVQDASEPPAPNIGVTLYAWDSIGSATQTALDLNGDPVAPTTTDASGYYFFDNLPSGEYVVQFSAPSGYTFPLAVAPWATTATDSDADVLGYTAPFTLSSEATGDTIVETDPSTLALFTNPTIDAGLIPPLAGVAANAWQDYDADGSQDSGEPHLPGVVVELLNADGTPASDRYGFPVSPTSTDSAGFYAFTDLYPGLYRVRFTLPRGYEFTLPFAGDYLLDSNAETLTGLSDVFEVDDADNGYDTVTDPYGLLGADLVNNTIDVGAVPPLVGVGDLAWQDVDGDGSQDAGEPPLAGVTVTLYEDDGVTPAVDASGTVVAPVVTGVDGRYFFDGLYPRDYSATFSLPTGYTRSPAFAASAASDSNADPSTGSTGVFTVWATPFGSTVYDTDAGTDAQLVNPTIDAGYEPPAVSVGDHAWQDLDGDGVQGAGEPALAGVIVELLTAGGVPATRGDGTTVGADVTDASGDYGFTNLLPGSYRVRFTLPAGYAFTLLQAGGSPSADSDAHPVTGLSAPFEVTPASTTDIDVGAIPPTVGVGDRAWRDLDKDGVQDVGEPPLAGVTVTLYDSTGVSPATDRSGATVSPTVTDSTGRYFFDDLIPGSYVAHFSQPTDYSYTTDASPLLTVNSDADPATGFTAVFDVAAVVAGTTVTESNALTDATLWNDSIDAGYIDPVVGIGDHAWQDLNQDGLQTLFEPPLAGVTVELLRGDGTVAIDVFGNFVDPVLTDATGFYFFDNLAPGQYRVQFTLPTGYTFTTTSSSDDFLLDSDANPATGRTAAFSVSDSVNPVNGTVADNTLGNALFVNPSVDVGAVPPVVGMGDLVWVDSDRDGIQDPTEPGLAGVTVELLDAFDQPAVDTDFLTVGQQITGEDGYYFFDNLVPGTYRVRFTPPAGYVHTLVNQGSLEGRDSDADTTTHLTATFTVAAHSTGHTVTDVDGDTRAQLANLSVDAGFVPIVALGDYVWFDTDDNGAQDEVGTGVVGVTVQLHNAADDSIATDYNGVNVAPVTTDASGYYYIGNLLPGSYYAVFTLPNSVNYGFARQYTAWDEFSDSDPHRVTGRTDTFTIDAVVAGATESEDDPSTDAVLINRSVDAGVVPLVAIGDIVWSDLDHDGVIDGTEPALAGVGVELLDAAGDPVSDADGATVLASSTNGSGVYLFDNLFPGEYTVRFTAPSGFVFSPQDQGSDDTVDSDPDPATGTTDPFTVNPSATGNTTADSSDVAPNALFIDSTIDAGVVPVVAVGNRVWLDANNDGVQSIGESGVSGVVVKLYPSGSLVQATTVLGTPAQATTNGSGAYLIDNLAPGIYYAVFTLPDPIGYTFTAQGQGADTGADSNANRYSGVTSDFVVSAEASGDTVADVDGATSAIFVNPTIDAGVLPVVGVSNFVWFDVDADGERDGGESGAQNVQVQLLNPDGTVATDADGAPVSAVNTAANGSFFIDNVVPGSYRLRFTPTAGYGFTKKNAVGADADEDSDANPDGVTDTFAVAPSATAPTVADANALTAALFVNPTVGAGLVQLVAVGDFVWIDANENGLQDPGEEPLFGMRVQLLDAAGNQARNAHGDLVAPVFTNASGRYVIDGLLPGTYRIRFTPPAYHSFTVSNEGISSLDSDADPGTGVTATFEIHGEVAGNTVADTDPATAAGFINRTIDAGVLPAELPKTGLSAAAVLIWAALACGFGVVLLMIARRRRSATAH